MLTVAKNLGLMTSYFRANLGMAMEYRVSFITQVLGMALNNSLWALFWWLFFQNFPSIGGWQYADLLVLYAVVTIGFGTAMSLMGNCNRISRIIAEGHLDYYLALPENVLIHVLVSRMDIYSVGDIVFGIAVYIISGSVSWFNTLLLLAASLLTAAIFVLFAVAAHSLTFYLGNAETLASQLFNALITFAMYPTSIFRGLARVLLFTVLPAGLIGLVPTELIRGHHLQLLAFLAAAVLAMGIIAVSLFYRGLRRYESGNLISIRL